MTGKGSKLIAIALVVVVVGAGFGYWMLAFKMPSQPVTYTTQQTSLTSQSQTAVQSWTTSSTITSSTTLAERVQWINVSAAAVQPISYYLNLLESNGAEPYVQLARELHKLPDLTNATAVAKITYLALNATNPEVKEAFELMIKGGTPDPRDFTYSVARYNTELQVLYWLACQNEFKKDDTLALAIAMVNGLWVTMGDDDVGQTVHSDTNVLLTFLRETDEIQKARGYPCLEDYPLEAKVALAWTGGLNMHWIGPLTQPRIPMRLVYYQSERIPLVVYEKDTVSVNTLRRMRQLAEAKGWWEKDVNTSVASVEEFFYFSGERNWEFAVSPEPILDEERLDAWLDADWQFNRYVNGSRPRGDCGTETVFIDAWAKSVGIATVPHWMYRLRQRVDSSSWYSHSYAIYFDPESQVWTAYRLQVTQLVPRDAAHEAWLIRYFIFRPPVDQRGYLRYRVSWTDNVPDYYYAKLAFCFKEMPFGETKKMMTEGVPTVQMKQWLLYS